MYIYIRTLYISDETRIQMKRKRKKKERIEVAFCNLDRTAFQICARILLVNPIRIELRPFVTPHPSKLLSDRALITSFFSLLLLHLSLFPPDHREINSIVLFVARAFTDRAHASIIFPAAKLAHPPLDAPPRFPWPRRQRRLTQ